VKHDRQTEDAHILFAVSFNLDKNGFTGPIPTELGGMNSLEYASAQQNTLTGSIPTEITSLGRLRK
jgi:hypothetical protein